MCSWNSETAVVRGLEGLKFKDWKNILLGSSEMKGPGDFEDAALVCSKRFTEAQDPDREPIPNVPNPHLITPFWLPNVLETCPFFRTFCEG